MRMMGPLPWIALTEHAVQCISTWEQKILWNCAVLLVIAKKLRKPVPLWFHLLMNTSHSSIITASKEREILQDTVAFDSSCVLWNRWFFTDHKREWKICLWFMDGSVDTFGKSSFTLDSQGHQVFVWDSYRVRSFCLVPPEKQPKEGAPPLKDTGIIPHLGKNRNSLRGP